MLTNDDIKKGATVLSRRLNHVDLDNLLKESVPPQLLIVNDGVIKGSKYEKSLLLVEARGSDILSDFKLRKLLISGDPGIASRMTSEGDKILLNRVALRSWHPGKIAAKNFASILGFPEIFAGLPGDSPEPTLVEIKPLEKISRLAKFQVEVVDQILNVLIKGETAMVSLPTGAGKTRVAMESIIKFQDRIEEGFIVWLGTTAEICEQACQAYLNLRTTTPPLNKMQLHRFWGSHQLNFDFKNGLIVASVQKLRSYVEQESVPYHMLKRINAVFFDEGHHAIAPTYEKTITYLKQSGEGKSIPLIGLTATPGRGSDPDSRASKHLASRFKMKLITPQGEEWKNPVEHLQKIGVLSKARMIEVVTNRKYALNEKMKSYWNDFKEFSPELLSNISKDKKRNEIIISEILKYKNKKGIIFACSIEHADYLAFLIRRSGLNAASVSASTRTANRKEILRELKDGKLDFITNFGVLTTGFDDPQLNMIVLARPVISQVLFEQMVGRGLRGPKFGGTEECIIMDFADNVELHGQPLAYKRFRRLWD